MKRITIAVVLGSTLAALAGSATAFPGAADDAGVRLPVQSTYADSHAVKSTVSAFPSAVDESGVRLLSGNRAEATVITTDDSAFPEATDEAGTHLAPMPASLEADGSVAN